MDCIVRKWKVDLEACTLTDLLSTLSQMQRTYSADYYLTITIRVKQILRFIDRTDLTEKIQLARFLSRTLAKKSYNPHSSIATNPYSMERESTPAIFISSL